MAEINALTLLQFDKHICPAHYSVRRLIQAKTCDVGLKSA
jgi:hypothetical protein